MPELREHAGRHYAVQFHYSLSDDAWCVEQSEAVPAPAAWTEIPNAATHLPGAAFLVAVIPDEDPDLEPSVHFHSHDEHVIPYEIVRWFMEQVAEQVERCRATLAHGGPETVGCLPLEDRVLLVAAYWRTNLTLRQLAPPFGVSKSAADRIIDHIGPLLALKPRQRFRKGTVLIVDGTLVPTRDHTIAEQSKSYRYSTDHQVVIDADTRPVVAVGKPLPGNRNDCHAAASSPAGRPSTTANTSRSVPASSTSSPG